MNPSCQVHLSNIINTRAHMTKLMTDRYICDGPSLGSHCVINEHTRPDPVGGNLKNWQPLKSPTPSFHPFTSLFLPFPSLFNFLLLTCLLYQLITFPITQIPKIYPLLVGVSYCGSYLANQVPSLLVFLIFSGVCL